MLLMIKNIHEVNLFRRRVKNFFSHRHKIDFSDFTERHESAREIACRV